MSNSYVKDFYQLQATSDFLKAKEQMNGQIVTLKYLVRDLYNYTTQIAMFAPISGNIPDKLLSLRFGVANYKLMKECYSSFKDYQSSSASLEEELQTVYSAQNFKDFFTSTCSNIFSSSVYNSVIKNLDDHIAMLEKRKTWQDIQSKKEKVEADRESFYNTSKFNQTELDIKDEQLTHSFRLLDYCSDHLLLEHNKSSAASHSSDAFSRIKSYFAAKPSTASTYLDSLNNFVSKVKESVLGTGFTNDINNKESDSDAELYGANINSAYSAMNAGVFLTCIKDANLIAKKIIYGIESEKSFDNLYFYQQYRETCDQLFNQNFSKNHYPLVPLVKDAENTIDALIYNLRKGQVSSFTFTKTSEAYVTNDQCVQQAPELVGSSESYDSEAGSSESYDSEAGSSKSIPETEESDIFNKVCGFLHQLYDNSPSASVLTAAGVIAATSAIIYCKFLHPRPENEDQVNAIANKWGALAKKLLHPTTDQQIQVGDNLGHFEMRQAAEQALEMVRTADRITQNLDAAGTPGTFATEESFELAGDSELHSPSLDQAGD